MDFNKLLKKEIKDNKLKKIFSNPFQIFPKIEDAINISVKYNIALHPKYLFYWNELQASELILFIEFLKKLNIEFENKEIKKSNISNNEFKRTFEILGIEHNLKINPIDKTKSEEEINTLEFNELNTKILITNLGLKLKEINEKNYKKELEKQIDKIIKFSKENLSMHSNKILSKNNYIEIRDKGGTYIGCRMGRPEKAKMRKQFNSETRSHGLFPVGEGLIKTIKVLDSDDEKEEVIRKKNKNIIESFKHGIVEEEFRMFHCPKCDRETPYPKCEICSTKTYEQYFEKYTYKQLPEETEESIKYKKTKVDLTNIEKELRNVLGPTVEFPKVVKGISATINKHHTVEHISKGFLRALNNVFVNKDGTVRFDMIEMGITHFKPKEIGTSIKKLKELGYTHDYKGVEITDENQIIEILPQDVALPDCAESGNEFASDFIINTGNFIDDLLEKLYKMPKFYNFKTKEDTIGHYIIGLAPHTSAGIVGRIIGYTNTQGCFSHPVWHAAQRRNLDGDENGIMLLLDGLINTSREYLPDRRGSRTMDVSLVLTAHLLLDQIDDEVHGMDIVDHYPLDFYRANKEYSSPKSVKIENIDKRINKEILDDKYLGYKFTHNTENMNDTIMCSAYKSLPTMKDKLDSQLELATKIRAVDNWEVGGLIIDKHFMKDIKGNLRKFGMQTFRCTKCNTKYRRPPLTGRCTHCRNPSINFTISEGSIKKYVGHSFNIIKSYKIDPYIAECVELTNLRIEGVFGKEKEKQKSLTKFFG